MCLETKYSNAEKFLNTYEYGNNGVKKHAEEKTAEEKTKEQLVKSKQRVKDAGEVFTPRWVVREMLDLDEIKERSFELDTTFLEPACGNGNFIIQILVRKLMSVSKEAFDIDVARSIASIYGVDIAEDNVKETRERMMNAVKHFYSDNGMELHREVEASLWYILYRNIILGNTLKSEKYAENYSPDELVEAKAYTNTRVAQRDKNSYKASIVDLRANQNADTFNDLLISEWKFTADGVHRAEFKIADMANGNEAHAINEYAATDFTELYKMKDITVSEASEVI